MHARELVELAAIVSAHGPVLVREVPRLSSAGLEEYWMASKIRLDRWSHTLRAYNGQESSASSASPWPTIQGEVEEILSGEILTRVWTAVLCAHDRSHQTCEAEPIARSVLLGHLEIRHRCLTFLLGRRKLDTPAAFKLNAFRSQCERWTDLLVGYLAGLQPAAEFAFDPQRADDFAQDLNYQRQQPGGRQAWPLVLSSLRAAFQQGLTPQSPNADLNARIAAGILAFFPAELFDSTGLFRSLWLQRLMNAAQDAQGMIEELLKGGRRKVEGRTYEMDGQRGSRFS
jgi:hypothetical protein